MELKSFLQDLVSGLARLDFVTSVDLHTEVFTVKGRVHFKDKGFLEVYLNEQTQTTAIAWVDGGHRRWGIDRDNQRGWHRHPLENPAAHEETPAMSIDDIIEELAEKWRQGS